MANIEIQNPSGKPVGWYDMDRKTYYRTVDYDAGQMFKLKKYRSSLAISKSILQQLAKLECKKIQFLILNFEEEDFNAIIEFKEFLDKRIPIYFKGQKNSDQQYRVELQHWTRNYLSQRRL